jgi:FkbM family methyltransferase
MGIGMGARQVIRTSRRSLPFRMLASAAHKYLRAFYNEDFYDFSGNGECYAMGQLARWLDGKPVNVWDVGANTGEWAAAAHEILPACPITAFEIVPQIFAALTHRLSGEPWFNAVNAGLSDANGQAEVFWCINADSASSMTVPLHLRVEAGVGELVPCTLRRGDDVAGEIGAPGFLKIDVEGHEVPVLRGLQTVLSGLDAPDMIQFEYGATYIAGGYVLHDVYELLVPLGYKIGRLYPNYVDFSDYSVELESFRMGNYIAVRDERLEGYLSGSA